jgi:hypothetical protein
MLNPGFQYDGYTVPLTVAALGIGAGQHTITLAIADSGDHILDSAVFIEGKSFSTDPKPPGVPDGGTTAVMLGIALASLRVFRHKKA